METSHPLCARERKRLGRKYGAEFVRPNATPLEGIEN